MPTTRPLRSNCDETDKAKTRDPRNGGSPVLGQYPPGAMLAHAQSKAGLSPGTILQLVSTEQLPTSLSNQSGEASVLTGYVPTPHELQNEQFRAIFSGPATAGPGRFTDQKAQLYIRGTGGSTGFRHGDIQMLVITPTDPNAPLFGVAVLKDKNANTSGVLALDLQGSQSDLDEHGVPRHLTWSISPFAGAGSFTSGAFSLAFGQGTVDVKNGPPPGKSAGHRFHGAATISVIFQGTLFTPGTFNPITNSDLAASHSKIL